MSDFSRLAARLKERLPVLYKYQNKGPLETATGNRLFREQLDRQVLVFEQLVKESEMSALIESL